LPTLEVTSTPLTPSARLKAALRLTRWLSNHGADPVHAVVLFRTADPMTYFAGGVPLTRYQDDNAEAESRQARWAHVVCHAHPDRDHTYRSELAEQVRQTLGLAEGHCLVRFESTEPERVFYPHDGSMTNSSNSEEGH
jgi:hypothetical protein